MILSNKQHWRFRGRDLVGARFKGRNVWPKSVTPEIVRLTLAMTTNTTPAPFVITASAEWSANNAAAAFDQQQGGTIGAWATPDNSYKSDGTPTTNPHWIMVDLGQVRTITNYTLRARGTTTVANAAGTFPKDLAVDLSLDGSAFTNFDTQNNILPPTALYQAITFSPPLPKSARYVRFTVLKTNGTYAVSKFVTIGEIELYGY